jgi:hypothetical protein
MPRYEPQGETARALRALADQLLAGVELPVLLRSALPFVHRELDAMLAAADADPERARQALRPYVASLARAFDFTPEDLAA